MSKALYSSLEFYAKKFVEFGVSKASSSRFEFYANLVRWLMSQLGCVIQVLGQALSSIFEFYAKKPKHRHRRRAKKKVRKWRRRALPYGLVMKCLHRYASFVLVTIACAFSCKLERECQDRLLP